jgi:hypothetical protein
MRMMKRKKSHVRRGGMGGGAGGAPGSPGGLCGGPVRCGGNPDLCGGTLERLALGAFGVAIGSMLADRRRPMAVGEGFVQTGARGADLDTRCR